MKALSAAIAGFLLRGALASTGRSAGSGKQLQPEAPSPAPAPGLEALHITFEIVNFNYYDLTKVTCPKKVKVPKQPKAKEEAVKLPNARVKGVDIGLKPINDANVTKAIDEIHGHSDNIHDQVKEGFRGFETGDFKPPWMEEDKESKDDEDEDEEDSGDDAAASLLQVGYGSCGPMPDLTETKSTECTTVMDVLRDAIIKTVKGIIECLYLQGFDAYAPAASAPGAAPSAPAAATTVVLPESTLPAAPAGAVGLVPLPPMIAPAAFLQSRSHAGAPSPAFAASPGPSGPPVPDVNIFVTFTPGRDMQGGRSTMVEVTFLDQPRNGVDDIAMAIPLIQHAVEQGIFKKEIKKALHAVTGIKAKLHKVEHVMKVIEQWEVEKCEEHIKDLVQSFTLHYTRNQVPWALYNECTNFMTKMSFSHDYVLDPMDTARCRKATAKLERHWNYGENAEASDFEDMCVKACEAKYGRDAPKCHLHHGDQLFTQPHLF